MFSKKKWLLYLIKKPVKIAFDGFEYKGNVICYANKSSTIEGNKPNAIFNTIDTTATI